MKKRKFFNWKSKVVDTYYKPKTQLGIDLKQTMINILEDKIKQEEKEIKNDLGING